MSTRAQIAIQIGPEEWAHVYCHYDGYPSHMLPALARWTPEDILAAKEIRQVRADALDCFDPPRAPQILPHPTCELCHLYLWQDGGWVDAADRAKGPKSNIIPSGSKADSGVDSQRSESLNLWRQVLGGHCHGYSDRIAGGF